MSDPRAPHIHNIQICDLQAQLRHLGRQTDTLRTQLALREDEIVRLTALLLEAREAVRPPEPLEPAVSAPVPAPTGRPSLLARLTRLTRLTRSNG